MAATYATPAGTARYRQRFAGTLPEAHFREHDGLILSSIGAGTYLGDPDDATDARYQAALVAAAQAGCNVVDTAINYRHQRSERAVGCALRQLTQASGIGREELFVATKGGYLPFDGAYPDDPAQYLFDTFIQPGIIATSDIAAGCHCLAPRYLAHQLRASLRNLGLQTVDLYYLHNPEQQLADAPRAVFRARLREAFAALEQEVAAGRTRAYGIATWHGLRHAPNATDFLALDEVVGLAREAAGSAAHHFRAVQLPYNLAMPEALTLRNQPLDGQHVSLLEAAAHFGLLVTASATLLQGQLLGQLPAEVTALFPSLRTDAQRALQFSRSTPGLDVALVGMRQPTHAAENLALARTAPLSLAEFERYFRRS